MSITIMINEEYRRITPDLTSAEYEALKADIKKRNGNVIPILVNQNGIILDGHHRYRACMDLGIEPKIEVREYDDPLEEKEVVIVLNANRRHYNDFQKAEQGYQLEAIEAERAKRRMLSGITLGSNEPRGKTDEIIAKKIGIKTTNYRRCKKIIEEGKDSAKEQLRKGNSSIFAEYKKIQILEKRNELIKRASNVTIPKGCQPYNGDFRDPKIAEKVLDNSIDFAITDLPFGKEYWDIYEPFGTLVNRVLKEGRYLVVGVGNFDIIHKLKLIEKGGTDLKFVCPLNVHHNGHTKVFKLRGTEIKICCKPYWLYVKGNGGNIGASVSDYIESEPPDKSLHEWAQSTVEARYWIERFTLPNELVLDLCMGVGTFGIPAVKLKRQFIGIEKDEETFKNAQVNFTNLG